MTVFYFIIIEFFWEEWNLRSFPFFFDPLAEPCGCLS